MNGVIDCTAARWMPSRHRYALFRLAALARLTGALRNPPPLGVDRLVLSIDRDQSVGEQYAVAAWFYTTTVCYLTSLLGRSWRGPIAFLAALPLASFLIQLSFLVGPMLVLFWKSAGAPKSAFELKANSMALMIFLLLASSYFATVPSPVRFVAWLALLLMATNAIAAMVMWLARGRVAALEQQCVG